MDDINWLIMLLKLRTIIVDDESLMRDIRFESSATLEKSPDIGYFNVFSDLESYL